MGLTGLESTSANSIKQGKNAKVANEAVHNPVHIASLVDQITALPPDDREAIMQILSRAGKTGDE